MTAYRIAPLAVPVAAAGLIAAAATQIQLPWIFPYSDAVIFGLATTLLAIAGLMMLPDRALHDGDTRLRHAFSELHGIGGGRAESALRSVYAARHHAERLETASEGFIPELEARVTETAHRLTDLAKLIFYKPETVDRHRALIVRAESVVDAVETHAKLRRKTQDETVIADARQQVIAALDSLSSGLEASDAREIAALLSQIDVSVGVAESLLTHR